MKSTLISVFLNNLKVKTAAIRRGYEKCLNNYLDFLKIAAKSNAIESAPGRINANWLIKNATSDTIIAFKNKLFKSYKASGVVVMIDALRNFYRFLAEKRLIEASPFPARADEQKDKWVCLKEQEIALMAGVHDESTFVGLLNRAIIWLMYSCGLTLTELVEIKTSHIKNGKLQIQAYKGIIARELPIKGTLCNEPVKKYLAAYFDIYKQLPPGALLVNEDNMGLYTEDVRQMLRESWLLAGELSAISPNDIRHSFAKRLEYY